MKKGGIVLAVIFMITATALLGCGQNGGSGLSAADGSPQNTTSHDDQTPVPPKQLKSPYLPEYHQLTIDGGRFRVQLTNLGWCQLLRPAYVGDDNVSCLLHDYTKIVYKGKTGYLYRSMKMSGEFNPYSVSPAMPDTFTDSAQNSSNLTTLFNASSKKWDEAMRTVAPLAKDFTWKIKFSTGAYLHAIELRHQYATDRCRSMPVWTALRAYTPDKQGDFFLDSGTFSYLDLTSRYTETTLEVDLYSGRVISIPTYISAQPFSSFSRWNSVKPENYLFSFVGGASRFRNARKPRILSNSTFINSFCDEAYDWSGRYGFQPQIPFGDYYPLYDRKHDKEYSREALAAGEYAEKLGEGNINSPYLIFKNFNLDTDVVNDPKSILDSLPLPQNLLRYRAVLRAASPQTLKNGEAKQ